MRWYFSYPIFAAGILFGAQTYLPRDHSLARTPDAAVEPPAANVIDLTASGTAGLSRLEAFSPESGLINVAYLPAADEQTQASILDYLARAFTSASMTAPHPVSSDQPASASEWKSAVVLDVREPEIRPQPEHARARTTITPRDSLARDIQTELQRVGCYMGEIDGVWGSGSKRAILNFMDRVNASLPAQEPDVFMLSLLRAEDREVCGSSCPSGQSLTGSGRCLPSSLIASDSRSKARGQRLAAAATEAADREFDRSFESLGNWDRVEAARRPPLPGRMTVGGPTPPPEKAVPLPRTAALQDEVNDQPLPANRMPAARSTSFDTAEPPAARPSRVAPSARQKVNARSAPVRRSAGNYRHVQRLFEHPLGRM